MKGNQNSTTMTGPFLSHACLHCPPPPCSTSTCQQGTRNSLCQRGLCLPVAPTTLGCCARPRGQGIEPIAGALPQLRHAVRHVAVVRQHAACAVLWRQQLATGQRKHSAPAHCGIAEAERHVRRGASAVIVEANPLPALLQQQCKGDVCKRQARLEMQGKDRLPTYLATAPHSCPSNNSPCTQCHLKNMRGG